MSVSNFKSLSSLRRPRCNINKINIKAGAKTKLDFILSAGSNCLCRCNAAEVIRMSSRAGVVIFRMARYYSTEQVLEMVLHSECQDSSSSSSEDSGEETDFSVELEQPSPVPVKKHLTMRAKGRWRWRKQLRNGLQKM